MTTPIEDIPLTLVMLHDEMKGLKRKITEGRARYTILKGLLTGYNTELRTTRLDSPVILVEIEEQIENMKTLIREERDQINADIALWHNLNDWKKELNHQVHSSS